MPKSVDEVRLSIDRVRLMDEGADFSSESAGVAGVGGVVDIGASCQLLCGNGRSIFESVIA